MKITDKYVFFWKEEPFTNFTKCVIKFRHPDEQFSVPCYHTFSSSEQLFMWLKAYTFNDYEIMKKILETDDPQEARKLGRQVKNYDDEKWSKERYTCMRMCLFSKFIQNAGLREQLCDPIYDGKTFVEAAYYDNIWGIGYNQEEALMHDECMWGQNLLGKLLTEIREFCINNKEAFEGSNS